MEPQPKQFLMVEPNFLGSGTKTGARAWNISQPRELYKYYIVFQCFFDQVILEPEPKIFTYSNRIRSQWLWMPLAGPRAGNLSPSSITLQWVWMMLDDTVFDLFLDQKNVFCFIHFGKSWHRPVANDSWLFLKNKQSNETYKKKNKSRKCRKVEIRAPTHF